MLKPNSESRNSSSAKPFQIEVVEQEGQNLLVLSGSIDLSAAPQLLAASLKSVEGSVGIAVDWSAADYVHVSSLQILLCLRSALARNGRTLRITGDSPTVRGFLELAGLSTLFAAEGRKAS